MSRKFALIIGNSEYDDPNLSRLTTPDTDVDALAEVLRSPPIGGFDEVATLVNQPATEARRAIARFFAAKQRDDLLLLYFSGHGVLDDHGHLFLAVKDTERDLLSGTALPASFVTNEMDRSHSRIQVLILDCCHSGAFARGAKGVVGASVGTATAFEGSGSGRVILTATDATQYAWEGDQVIGIGQAENSVFTRHLIDGLQAGKADVDGDGRITIDEWYDYVYDRVVRETPRQTPGKWSYRQQGEIVIARNPHAVAKPVGLPPELQQSIEDPRPWVRQGTVPELERLLKGSDVRLARQAHAALRQLTNDDSRQVATAAASSLAAFGASRRVSATRDVPRTPSPIPAGGETTSQPKRASVSPILAVIVGGLIALGLLAAVGISNQPQASVATTTTQPRLTDTVNAIGTATATDTVKPPPTDVSALQVAATSTLEACAHASSIAPLGWSIVVCDVFDSNLGRWLSGRPPLSAPYTGELIVTDGKYRIRATASGSFVQASAPDRDPVSDFYAMVEARQVAGPIDGEYGLVFRFKDSDNYYVAQISERKWYRVEVQYANEWETLVGYTDTPLIRPGEVNRLTVVGRGSHFEFYINDQLAVSFEDDRLSSGKAGVLIELHRAGDAAEFEFDNFELRTP